MFGACTNFHTRFYGVNYNPLPKAHIPCMPPDLKNEVDIKSYECLQHKVGAELDGSHDRFKRMQD